MLKLFKKLKPYSIPLFFVVLLLLIQTVTQLYLPTMLSKIVDKGILGKDVSYIVKIGGYMIGITFIGSISTICASFLSSRIAMGFGRDLRRFVFTKTESFSLAEVDTIGTASLITRTTNDITQVQQLLMTILTMMVVAPLTCIAGIYMAIQTNPNLSLILVVSMPLVVIAILFIGKIGMPRFKAMQTKLDKINKVLRENLTGIRVVRAFNKQDVEKARFEEANFDFTDNAIKVNRLIAILMPLLMLLLNLTSVAILWFGATKVNTGTMEVGNLMAFIQYTMQIMFSLIMVSMLFIMIPRAAASANRINKVLAIEPSIKNPENATSSFSEKGTIEFKNVSFSFPGAENNALSNINFKVNPGETTAIIGGTGSGKSTILNLINRFYDSTKGEILVNGTNVKTLPIPLLRSRLGFVPQKAVLFSGTIEENLKFGKEDASMDDMIHASKISQSYDFVLSKEDGFNSLVDQGGRNFSGGQKQRLSIARALIRKPDVYLFDDSFSALDFKTDANLRAALKKETYNAAILIVAQRINTIKDADNILVINEGKVVGHGTHRELLKTCSVYQEIASSQLSKEELENE